MSKHGKKYNNAKKSVNVQQQISASDAVATVKKLANAKFDESVDVDIVLGIDASKGDQVVRGSVILPFAIGKKPRIIAFAKGDYADKAEKAGADFVGSEDLIDKILGGWMEFDYAIATPDLMGAVGKLAKILGPKGLLPNKRLGTVTFEVSEIIEDLKQGRLFFKNDKSGLVHFRVGKVSQTEDQVKENLMAFVRALSSVKPATSKGRFIKKMTISSTMGVGISVNCEDFLKS